MDFNILLQDKFMAVLLVYVLFLNLLAFLMMGIDKAKAQRKRWRIPEATLLTLAALGGSAGLFLAMRFFRHKVNRQRHPAFTIGVPVMLILQILILLGGLFLHYGSNRP